jgi:predicted Zn-dependent peptidase
MRTRILALDVALLLAFCSAPAARAHMAQAGQPAPPPSKSVVLKGKAPVSDEVLRVKLPRPQEVDLSNGLHLIVLEDRRLPQISFNLVIRGAGGYFDPADLPGAATFTAAMMREGTTTRNSQEISQELETLAAFLNVSSGMSSITAGITGSCLTEHVDRLFDLFADVLLNPAFPQEELDRYKQRTRANLIQQRSSPGFLANEMFARVMYGQHPSSRVSPTAAALDTATRAALVEFHKTHYVPDHAALAIAGDISLGEARKLVETKLAGWKKAGRRAPEAVDPPMPPASKIYLVSRPNSVQTNFIVGVPAIDRVSRDYDVLQVMNQVIGGGPTGRLFLHLREEKGYTYGAYSGISALRTRGHWSANTDVRSEVTEAALRDLLAEITRMREEAVPDKEFRDRKRAMIASFALGLENPSQILNYYTTNWIYKLPPDYWDKFPDRVAAVTQAQVQAAAKKYLDASRLQIVAVGDGAKVGSILKAFGEVETYDSEGKKIGSSTN